MKQKHTGGKIQIEFCVIIIIISVDANDMLELCTEQSCFFLWGGGKHIWFPEMNH